VEGASERRIRSRRGGYQGISAEAGRKRFPVEDPPLVAVDGIVFLRPVREVVGLHGRILGRFDEKHRGDARLGSDEKIVAAAGRRPDADVARVYREIEPLGSGARQEGEQ